MAHKRPTALIILDGCGLNPSRRGNAVWVANKPVLERLFATCPWATLGASGEDVGLMAGQMGDSNVGHLNIGAGRVVYQYVQSILRDIANGAFFHNPVLRDAMAWARERHRPLHLLGLVSPGGVHSHQKHLYALLELAKREGAPTAYIHAFTDGRDVPPTSGSEFMAELEETCAQVGFGRVSSVSGRYFAMDRDRRWERTAQAYRAIVLGEGESAGSGREAVRNAYARGETDEFIKPTVIRSGGAAVGRLQPGDAAIFFNFRADRARQLTRALVDREFAGFERPDGPLDIRLVTLTRYEENFDLPFAYLPHDLSDTLGEVASKLGWKQLRIAETEKYAHVTFFFNGGRETPFPGEVQRLIPSPKVATYDLKPEMSAFEVAAEAVNELATGEYDLMILNFANMDMVGHTGVMEAAVKAAEAVDACLGQVLSEIRRLGGQALVTADHGNADQMIDYETGGPHTYHTTYRVPVILVSPECEGARLTDGVLGDLAPTLLDMAGVAAPAAMTGRSLLARGPFSAQGRGTG